jgi:hypothetical protein
MSKENDYIIIPAYPVAEAAAINFDQLVALAKARSSTPWR